MENLAIKLRQHYKVECFDKYGKFKWAEEFDNRVSTVGLNKYLDATLKTGLASPAWYVGLVGATQTDGAITSGQAILTSAAGAFTSADVGQPITVQGAGAAGADLNTTVLSYQSATQVTLAANAGTTVTGKGYLIGCRLADTMASHAPWAEVTPYSGNRPAFTPGTISSGSVDNSASKAVFTINAGATVYGAFMNDANSGTAGVLLGMGPFAASRGVLSGDTLNVTITCSLS
jgi:hypothetical protein